MRLIDADSLIESIERLNRPICDDYHMKGYVLDQIIQDIRNEPTIEERKKGKWIKLYEGNYKCSECGDWWGIDNNEMVEDFKFCPNCGADMRGEE